MASKLAPIQIFPADATDLGTWKGSIWSKVIGLEVWEGSNSVYIEGLKKGDNPSNSGIRLPRDAKFIQELADALSGYVNEIASTTPTP